MKNAKEIIEQYFNKNPNKSPYFYWGGESKKITLYKNNVENQIYINISQPNTFFGYMNLTIKYPQDVEKIKDYLFRSLYGVYYGDLFEDLNDKHFILALKNNLI